MSIEQDILAIERSLWTGGPEDYERHADDRCLVVFPDMTAVMAKGDIARSAEKGRWSDVRISPKGTVHIGGDAVAVAYECAAVCRHRGPYRALVSSVYRRTPNGWKIALHQQTPLPTGGADQKASNENDGDAESAGSPGADAKRA